MCKTSNMSSNLNACQNWWEEAVVQYGFNIPSVTVNLERLMGTNIVHMTDLSFMLTLRKRVWNAFSENLNKRINERKRVEEEREAQLILKGGYNFYNRPPKFIPFHSTVLALDLGCGKNLTNNSDSQILEHIKSPILKINKRTNAIINERRLKFNSIRQRNIDRVIEQTKKEGLEPNIHHDGLGTIEAKIKEIQNKILAAKSRPSRMNRSSKTVNLQN